MFKTNFTELATSALHQPEIKRLALGSNYVNPTTSAFILPVAGRVFLKNITFCQPSHFENL